MQSKGFSRVLVRLLGLTMVAGLLPWLCVQSAQAADSYESESNNTIATADGLALGDIGHGATLGSGYQDVDYYYIDVPQAGLLDLEFGFPNGLGAGRVYTLGVLNDDGTALYAFSVGGADWDGSWLTGKAMSLPAGRAYLSVRGNDNAPSWGKPYTLSATVAAGLVETERNGTTATADALPLAARISGSALGTGYEDLDYFYLDVPQAGRLDVEFRFPNGLGAGRAYSVGVLNADGTSLYAFSVGGADWDGSGLTDYAMFLPAGRAYLSVRGNDNAASWGKPYTLKATLTPGLVETEVNGATATADGLPLGATITGSTLNASYVDRDYYYVDVPRPTPIALDFRFPNGLGTGSAYHLTIYDRNGTRLYAFSVTGSDYSGAWARAVEIALPAGRAYLAVEGRDSYPTWGRAYTLQVGLRFTATPTPTISGTATFGRTLTVTPGTWAPAPVALSYQWLRDGTAIRGATATKYKLTASDVKHRIAVRVTGSRSGFLAVSRTSATRSVTAAKLSATPTPGISGTAKVGKSLTARVGTWAPKPVTLRYQWYRSGKAIAGATRPTYKLVKADKRKSITVKVTGTKAGYAKVTKVSKATKRVK